MRRRHRKPSASFLRLAPYALRYPVRYATARSSRLPTWLAPGMPTTGQTLQKVSSSYGTAVWHERYQRRPRVITPHPVVAFYIDTARARPSLSPDVAPQVPVALGNLNAARHQGRVWHVALSVPTARRRSTLALAGVAQSGGDKTVEHSSKFHYIAASMQSFMWRGDCSDGHRPALRITPRRRLVFEGTFGFSI